MNSPFEGRTKQVIIRTRAEAMDALQRHRKEAHGVEKEDLDTFFDCAACGILERRLENSLDVGSRSPERNAMSRLRDTQIALKKMMDAAEMLWSVVANVSEGDWKKQNSTWQKAAARWRDDYFKALDKARAALKGTP